MSVIAKVRTDSGKQDSNILTSNEQTLANVWDFLPTRLTRRSNVNLLSVT